MPNNDVILPVRGAWNPVSGSRPDIFEVTVAPGAETKFATG